MIPQQLRGLNQWVAWKEEERDGDLTKVPVNVRTEGYASSSDPDTWTDYQTAASYADNHDEMGLGFVFSETDQFTGFDYDDIIEGEDMLDWALEDLQKLDTYSEFSPSGTGVHAIAVGNKPSGGNKTSVGDGGLEMYDSGRFFTMTGDHVGDTPREIKQRNDVITEIFNKYLAEDETDDGGGGNDTSTNDGPQGNSLSDQEVIEKAKDAKNGEYFTDLWNGNWEPHSHRWSEESHSEADLALCDHLAWWTNSDKEQMNRLFRQSGLMREKWDRDDYRNATLDEAISNTDDGYTDTGWSRVRWMYDNPEIPKRRARYTAFNTFTDEGDFATIEETNEILHYDDGVYEGYGENVIGRTLLREIEEHYTINESRQLKDMIQRATARPVSDFGADTDDPVVRLENGTLDLETMTLRDHSPDNYLLTGVDVKYDPEADCPEFDAFLDSVLGREEDKKVIYEMLGYCLWPGYDIEQKFLIMHGTGSNGKGILTNVMTEFLGSPNIANWDLQDLESHDFALAELHQSFANISGDLPATKLKSTGTLKKLTGGDEVTAEKKNKDPFSFENRAKLIFSANDPPVIPDRSTALARRMLLVEFPYTFTNEDDGNRDAGNEREMMQRMTTDEEMSGILNRALEGLERIKSDGFSNPETIDEMREKYKHESDPIHRFIEECLTESTGFILKEQVHNAYNQYAKEHNDPEKSDNVFHRELKKSASINTNEQRRRINGTRERLYNNMGFTQVGEQYTPLEEVVEDEDDIQGFEEILD